MLGAEVEVGMTGGELVDGGEQLAEEALVVGGGGVEGAVGDAFINVFDLEVELAGRGGEVGVGESLPDVFDGGGGGV